MDGNNNKKRIFPWKCYNHIFIMNKMNFIMNHHSSKRWKEWVVHFYSFWRRFHKWINKENTIEIILENILWKYILENKGIKVALLFSFLMKYLLEKMIIIAIDKNETFFLFISFIYCFRTNLWHFGKLKFKTSRDRHHFLFTEFLRLYLAR